jgi:serine phosphatase RsbU (regulator of sigma subunit)/ligand-binding sensor domain-containing protein
VIQDKYGRVLVANNDGVLVNNGTEWQITRLSFLCLSLAKNSNNEIFAGGDGNFGKFIQTNTGEFAVESFTNLIPKDQQEVNKIWAILPIKDHVYFCSNQKIFDYSNNKIEVILPGEEGFHTFFNVNDHLVVKERGKGLEILRKDNKMVLVKGGEILAGNDAPVRGIVQKNKLYYLVSPKGIFEFDVADFDTEKTSIKKIITPIDAWLAEKTVYCSATINSGNFAFGSSSGGLVITNSDFIPSKYINAENELQDDGVNFIYSDYQGHIWLALAKGISYIEFNSPITRFSRSEGIRGTIESCISYNNTLYLATDKGLLVYNENVGKFELTNLSDLSGCLAIVDGDLIAGTRSGLYRLEKNEFVPIYETPSNPHVIYVPKKKLPREKGTVFYVGTESGFAKLSYENKKIVPQIESYELNADVRTIADDKDGALFLGTTYRGVFMLAENGTLLAPNKKSKLNETDETSLIDHNGDLMAVNGPAIYHIKKENNVFHLEPAAAFDELNKKYIFLLTHEVIGNELWLNFKPKDVLEAPEGMMCLKMDGNNFTIKATQLSRIKEADAKSICHHDSLIYIGTNNGLYCYDNDTKGSNAPLVTFINKIKIGKSSARVFFNITPESNFDHFELSYKDNFIEVVPGASDFIDKNELLFAHYLEGLETNYKGFAHKKTITYDYLHEGTYVLHLKSMNILGVEGEEIRISFTISPPWYRTTFAYVAYLIALILIIYLIIKFYSKRLIEQNIKLEQIISERTKEIQLQKHEIEHKNQEITDSINYAKGIQDSILPDMKEIKKVWADQFIFFQPKDIVSGDFYWFEDIKNNEFLIACCDCTGHGVPGGFMSMICSGKLHDATLLSTEPDQILFHSNNSIKLNLKQQGEGKNKDGMEIALVKVNTKTRKVKYAGANRPLWIFHKKTGELSEIKPTKASIASSTEFETKYEQHEINLEEGDIVYLTSDGYADQFGGTTGKKYMSKNFKTFLVSKANLSMSEQLKEINININSWMLRHEQVDDLLVIGIKF